MQADFAARLRQLRDQNNWTVADMAERTGIPKQTLDKYLLRSGASLPSFEGLVSLSRGLGVSLDWLVFGADHFGEMAELLVERAARDAALMHYEMLLRELRGGKSVVNGDLILDSTPEESAADLAYRAAARAKQLASEGVTQEELIVWRQKHNERQHELLLEKFERHGRRERT